MAINVSKTSHFTDGAGTAISFSEIRAQFGGSATNVKASTYLRNTETTYFKLENTTKIFRLSQIRVLQVKRYGILRPLLQKYQVPVPLRIENNAEFSSAFDI